MNSNLRKLIFFSSAAFVLAGINKPLAQQAPPPLVISHYMVCCDAAGANPTIEDLKTEILSAQKSGIDGFAVNVGGWRKEAQYKRKALLLYEAADQLHSGFKLLISMDFCCGNTLDDFRDALESVKGLPNQLRVDDKPVISTFGRGKPDDNGHKLAAIAHQAGALIAPYYYPSNFSERPDQGAIAELVSDYPDVDGYFYFGAAGLPNDIASVSVQESNAWHQAHKFFIAPVTPFYRGKTRSYESDGFKGMQLEWMAAINSRADWVEIVTWNDFTEGTYVSNFADSVSATQSPDATWRGLYSHFAFLKASEYYIKWFKNRTPPSIEKEEMFYFYHPDPIKTFTNYFIAHGPLGFRSLSDSGSLTTFLKYPATVSVSSGGQIQNFEVAAGVQNLSFFTRPGEQVFSIARQGKVLARRIAEVEIGDKNNDGNFLNYFSGSIEF